MANIVEVKDLKKRFGAFEAVKGVSFSVAQGRTFGFLGPNGAGKSTTTGIISLFCPRRDVLRANPIPGSSSFW